MGFDIHGQNPVMNKPKYKFPLLTKYDDIPFGEREDTDWKEEQDQYFMELDEYEEINPGVYFRNNCWWWRQLWRYCEYVSPRIITPSLFNKGHYNDGSGLNNSMSKKLGNLLLQEIDNGGTLKWKEEYEEYLSELQDLNCDVCNNNNRGNNRKDNCNICKGKGTTQHFLKNYPFDVENVRNFSKFLIQCGGFEIW